MTDRTQTTKMAEVAGSNHSLVSIENLSIRFGDATEGNTVVDRVSVSVGAGEIVALVGESGSGKTMVSRVILGLLPPGGHVSSGRILFKGRDLAHLSAGDMQDIRGAEIGMVFQEPMTSLNPTLTIGFQMAEGLKRHAGLTDKDCKRRAIAMLTRVRIPNPEQCLQQYPHEFSGGMRQRILLASVLMQQPALLIADEPTTALDVLAQKQVMDIMYDIVRDMGISVLLITHDLGLVAEYSDKVAVMCKGQLLDHGNVSDTLLAPKHPYTRKLLAALPERGLKEQAREGATLCEVRDLHVAYEGRRKWPWQAAPVHKILHDINLTIEAGEMMVVVGESGSGKTTLAKTILGLVGPTNGQISYQGQDVHSASKQALRQMRQSMQMVFQDPYSALDPRMSIGDLVAEGLRHDPEKNSAQRRQAAADILAEVGLGDGFFNRFPHELSGGQRQRVNIARALVSRPDFVVADEPVSALDITVQKEILELFKSLQERHGFTCLFITHDLSVTENIADRIAVMYRGRLVEQGSRDQVFDTPCHPYTRQLLEAAPRLAAADGEYRLQTFDAPKCTLPERLSFTGWEGTAAETKLSLTHWEREPGHLVACNQAR